MKWPEIVDKLGLAAQVRQMIKPPEMNILRPTADLAR
jgi:hypothetical protein